MLSSFVKNRLLVALLCAALAGMAWGGPARADIITFDLTAGNSAISGFPGPYEQVVVNRTSSTTATITFTSLTNAGNIYLMGDGGTVGVNVNATSFTLGTITGSNAGTGFTPGPYSNGGAGNEDGFGSFNLTINSFDGYTHSSDTVSFTITNNSGTWATASDVLTPNDTTHNAEAAAHVFITTFPANAANGAIVTGFAAGTGGGGGTNNVTTPAPPGVVLMATGMVMLGLFGWSRRRALARAA
jgi:hypothetical protein